MQAELKMCSISSDTVAKMWCHQYTVLGTLGIVEHPVFPSLRKKTDVGHKNVSFLRNSVDKWSKNISIIRSLTEMASLVQVSMMGCSRLSNSVMSNWVSTNNFWVCCSIAKAMAAVTCSYMGGKGITKCKYILLKLVFI